MAALLALICVTLCSILTVSGNSISPPLPTHAEVLEQLWPHRAEIRNFVLTRMIGQSQSVKEENPLLCATCQLGVTLAFSFLEQGTPEEVEAALINICIELDILAPEICVGALEAFFPHAYHILTGKPLTVDDICGVLIQNNNCGILNETMTDWEVIVDGNKPEPVTLPHLPNNIPTTKILHVTDIHLDLDYAEGSLTECGKPLCCRRGEGWEEPWNSSVEAGPIGDYNCDIPEKSMQNAFNNAAERYDYKFVILGGDYVHHAVWMTTKEDVIRHYTSVSQAILAAFPETPVYPIIGNHETHPTNVFPPRSVWSDFPEFDIAYVYNTLADLYETKLTPEALVTFRKGGYYTITPQRGLRVITLNTMFCYTLNFWILYEPADPEGQLQWFSDQMKRAEDNEEKVFILGHIPPGVDDCWSIWNNHYSAVVDRYQNIILGQFYGHTHNDDFKIYFDQERPASTAFITPSVTSYTDINPGYRVFHFDGERDAAEATWEMVDYETFTYNLTEANANQEPIWYLLYSAKESYGLKSLRPADLYDFVLRMAEDGELFQLFYTHYNKNSDTVEPCDDPKCVYDMLCALLTFNHNDKSRCDDLDKPLRQRFLR